MSYERDTSVLFARALPQNYEVVRVSCRGECVGKIQKSDLGFVDHHR